MPRFRSFSLLLLTVLLAVPMPVRADRNQPDQDLKKLTLEELSLIDVTSVSRRAERLSETAAAVSVLRGEDVLRSGATTLPEALRLGDGIDVAQVNAATWGISARGFNISTANKLLVLIDGRSVYSPLSGGVFWETQDLLLADLDRIEVIRGPGGTIWGANAVNGVINIISRPAAETQGTIATLIGGTNEMAVASARHGGRMGTGFFRVYGKYRHRGPQLFTAGGSAKDDVDFGQGGFRIESAATARTRWFVSGAAYRGSLGFSDRENGRTTGGHVLARLTRRTRLNGEFELQAYYDRADRRIPRQFDSSRDTGEVDTQQSLRLGRHHLVFGSTFRISDARDRGIAGFVFDPERRTSWTANAFVQDEFALLPRLFVTAGAKIGRNNFTGVEFQPNVRVRYQPTERRMAWGAVSRAVRLPTRFDTDLRIVHIVTRAVLITGSSEFQREAVVAYEGGYRLMPHPRVALDIAAFANRYDDLRSQELRSTPRPVMVLANALNATTRGVEAAGTVQPLANWRLHASYTWFGKTLSLDPGSTDLTRGVAEGNDPAHRFLMRSYLDLPKQFAFDAILRSLSERPSPLVQGYTELDLRVGWAARPGWELSVVGQNLLHSAHEELTAGGPRQQFRRAVFLRSIWQF